MAGDAGEEHAKVHFGGLFARTLDARGDEPDVVGVGGETDAAAAVETDIELARKPVQVPIVDQVQLQRARQRARVDQLGRIDARQGRTGYVAYVVGTGPTRGQRAVRQARQYLDHVFRGDLPDLDVAARRDVAVATRQIRRDGGQRPHLRTRERVAGNPDPDHQRILRGRDVEKTVELEAIDVAALGRPVFLGVCNQLVPDVERVLLALELLFARDLVQRPAEPRRRFGLGGHLRRARGPGRAAEHTGTDRSERAGRRNSCGKPLQVLLLLLRKRRRG